jgi:predicted ATPase/DNA-binding SARP family transcriptional activator
MHSYHLQRIGNSTRGARAVANKCVDNTQLGAYPPMNQITVTPRTTPESGKNRLLQLCLFGELRAAVGGIELTPAAWKRESARKLVAYLALNLGNKVKRNRVAAFLGAEDDERKLSNALYSLRHALGPAAQLVLSSSEHVWLDDSADLWVDIEEFEQALDVATITHDVEERIRLLERASELYVGPLLAHFDHAHIASDREALRARHSEGLRACAELLSNIGKLDAAVKIMRRRFELDQTDETATQSLMQALIQVGQREIAVDIYVQHRATLASAAGRQPGKVITDLAKALHGESLTPQMRALLKAPESTGVATGWQEQPTTSSRVELKTLSELAQPESQRPGSPTPAASSQKKILGREGDIDEVMSLLARDDIRLVTIYGLGGVGKTTLADAIVQRWNNQREPALAECKVIDARSASRTEEFSSVIARALEVESGDAFYRTAATGTESLRYSLLVLDNFELVRAQRSVLSDVLSRFKKLRLLVTSRTPLGVAEEWAYLVKPLLSFAPACAQSSETTLDCLRFSEQSPIIQIFLNRARRSNPSFELSIANISSVLSIVHDLGGIPLAVEIAAARCRYMTPQSIAKSLSQDLSLLSVGTVQLGASYEEHRSMLGVLEWTYAALGANSQRLLLFLSVFVGGFTLAEIVEAVRQYVSDVYDRIDDLLDADMISSIASEDSVFTSEKRFRILEPVRRFAFSKLSQNPDALANAESLHAQHYVNVLASYAEMIETQPELVKQVYEIEEPNIETALAHLSSNDTDLLMRAVADLSRINSAVLSQPVFADYFNLAASLVSTSTPAEQSIHLLSGALYAHSFIRPTTISADNQSDRLSQFTFRIVQDFWRLAPDQQNSAVNVSCVFRAFQFQYLRGRCHEQFADSADEVTRRLSPRAALTLPAQRLAVLSERWRFNTTLNVRPATTTTSGRPLANWIVRTRLELRTEHALAKGIPAQDLLLTLIEHCHKGIVSQHQLPVLLVALHYAMEMKVDYLVLRLTCDLKELSAVGRQSNFHRLNTRLLRTVASCRAVVSTGLLSEVPPAQFADWAHYLKLSHDICIVWLRYVAPKTPSHERSVLLRLINEYAINDIPIAQSARLVEALCILSISLNEYDLAQQFFNLSAAIRKTWGLSATPLEKELRIEFRIDTVLRTIETCSQNFHPALVKHECYGNALGAKCKPLIESLLAKLET